MLAGGGAPWRRRGPTRFRSTGSVSMRAPSSSTRAVAWPPQVTRSDGAMPAAPGSASYGRRMVIPADARAAGRRGHRDRTWGAERRLRRPELDARARRLRLAVGRRGGGAARRDLAPLADAHDRHARPHRRDHRLGHLPGRRLARSPSHPEGGRRGSGFRLDPRHCGRGRIARPGGHRQSGGQPLRAPPGRRPRDPVSRSRHRGGSQDGRRRSRRREQLGQRRLRSPDPRGARRDRQARLARRLPLLRRAQPLLHAQGRAGDHRASSSAISASPSRSPARSSAASATACAATSSGSRSSPPGAP